jgi:hypothetical protein
MNNGLRQSARSLVSELAALCMLGGAALGFLLFGLMMLLGALECKLIGGAGIVALIAGLYCFFHPPR